MMTWRKLKGDVRRVSVLVGGVAVVVGQVVRYSSGAVVAVTDGTHADGVMHEAGDAAETNRNMDMFYPGDIWEATVASQTMSMGVKVAMAGADTVDVGTSSGAAVGRIVNYTLTASMTKAQVEILGEPATID